MAKKKTPVIKMMTSSPTVNMRQAAKQVMTWAARQKKKKP